MWGSSQSQKSWAFEILACVETWIWDIKIGMVGLGCFFKSNITLSYKEQQSLLTEQQGLLPVLGISNPKSNWINNYCVEPNPIQTGLSQVIKKLTSICLHTFFSMVNFKGPCQQ